MIATSPPNAMYAPARNPPTSALSQLSVALVVLASTAAAAVSCGVLIAMLTPALGRCGGGYPSAAELIPGATAVAGTVEADAGHLAPAGVGAQLGPHAFVRTIASHSAVAEFSTTAATISRRRSRQPG